MLSIVGLGGTFLLTSNIVPPPPLSHLNTQKHRPSIIPRQSFIDIEMIVHLHDMKLWKKG